MLENSVEVTFEPNQLIVSKTNPKGVITYANNTFMDVSGYDVDEIVGKPHKIIRHDFMPKAAFKMLWDSLKDNQEFFAYIVNKTKTNGHYWVLAHVTPSIDTDGTKMGYHSNRRVPDPAIIHKHIIPLYTKMNEIERTAANSKQGMADAIDYLNDVIKASGKRDYQHYIFTLEA